MDAMGTAAGPYYYHHSSTTATLWSLSLPNNSTIRKLHLHHHHQLLRCCSNSTPKPRRRGFGSSSSNTDKKKSVPDLSSQRDGKANIRSTDIEFEERLQAVKRSAIQQKKGAVQEKQYGVIDYDAPIEPPKSSSVGMGTKIGAGIAVAIFGLVFAFGDFLPSGSDTPTEEAPSFDTRISSDDRENLKKRLQQFEETLSVHPEDSEALEGAAVTLTQLGEYTRAATLLEDLSKKKPSYPDVFRLLGEVRYQLKDFEGSAKAYRDSARVTKNLDFDVLRGLTNALLADKKPGEAVQVLLASREQMNEGKPVNPNDSKSSPMEKSFQIDPIQVDLLLGKAYSDWGHVSDAVSVYDQLISSYPDDFRGYLAKGIILKENGNIGAAERMFIQARFFAPDKAKALVDKYSR